MLKHTKIVATVSDQRCDVEFIDALYKAGMNVVRLNTAHMDEEGLSRVVNNVRAVSNRIGILMDTKGPEVRTTPTENNVSIPFVTGDLVKISGDPNGVTTHEHIYVSYPRFVHDLSVGSTILIDDGDLELKVIEKHEDYLLCEAQNEATMGNRKSVNVPGVRINLPSLTDKDRKNILWAIQNDLDFIAHSFVRSKQDVLDIQHILDEYNSPIKIIAKIENQEGVDNIDEILEAAYGIMIARGDLGIEVAAEKIPGIQRILIRKCVEVKKPVIVATQMLHSMINNPRPTRAEVTDIANAIYYRTDALMLSGETAYGKYPVEAVQTMTKVAREAEKTKLAANDIRVPIEGNDLDVTSFLAKQAVKSSSKLNVKAIITDSHTGRTARYLAAFRGPATVFAICYRERVMRMLSLSYGVWAVHQPWNDSRRGYFYDALYQLIKSGRITRDNMVAYLSGSFGEGGGTTFLEINNVGRVLDASSSYTLPTFQE
ncbi:pyruvate kinase [Parabacteroides sp. AD58]|uniref:Pyruvate kinase n=1 Tax=Parabacteroides absconsus TaxID=2951805 RepID=A0ABZ2IMR1_9BACT|nr:pyruvate kinase [Parabacteroides sp. AD58]MCM6902661.1 pyruvate kinase [Parabacteroides sp. AD58]